MRIVRRRVAPSVLATIVIAIALSGVISIAPSGAAIQPGALGATRPQPNILFVLTDDLAAGDEAYMPNMRELIASEGATFDNYFISDSVCCPSRMTMLRGQYAHNTGVKTNGGGNGGFNTAYLSGVEHDTVATRLQSAGYRTGLFGKYLNRYPGVATEQYIPPGWSDWSSPVAGDPYTQHDYVLNHNGTLQPHGDKPSDHADTVFVGQARRFMHRAARDRVPFFAYLAVYAPHSPAHPAGQDRGTFADVDAPRNEAFDQPDVSKMPQFIQELPPLTSPEKVAIDKLYRRRIETLQAVDRGIGRLVTELRITKQLDNTYIVFTSDNGFHFGDHRLPGGKGTAYDTDIKVPMFVRGPDIERGMHISRFAGNVDIAPTLEDLAGAGTSELTDGRSLVPLLEGVPTPQWRTRYLVEHWRESGVEDSATAGADKPLTESPDPDIAGKNGRPGSNYGEGTIDDKSRLDFYGRIPDYAGIRTSRYLFVEYADGGRELYNVQSDPYEIDNLAGTRPALEHSLALKLARLRNCHDSGCRDAERGPVNSF